MKFSHELVKNIANRNPLNTEFNIKSSASNKTRWKELLKMLKLVHKFGEDQVVLIHSADDVLVHKLLNIEIEA